MTISVHCSTAPLTAHAVRSFPCYSVTECWLGAPLSHPFGWSLGLDPDSIWFSCTLPGGSVIVPNASSGEFVEGLWNGDVAELFIMSADGAYQEFNFSPSGAWWSMRHSAYRVRVPDESRPTLSFLDVSVQVGLWQVVAAIERSSLQVEFAATSKVHMAGYWYDPSPRFLSSRSVKGVEPDFHHAGCFDAVEMVRLP